VSRAPALSRMQAARRLPCLAYGLPIPAYIAAWGANCLVLNTTSSDLDLFFWRSAATAAHGHVLQIYAAQNLAGNAPNKRITAVDAQAA
jgi:hypothetical protein